jgi:hypothetical protein
LAQHTCDNCGATVGNDEFCPTCGAWIDPLQRDGGSPDEFEEFALGDTPADPDAAGPRSVRQPQHETPCPSCGSLNPASNRHCEECGARLSQGTLPVAPRPAVQTTAGVRAAIGISGVLVLVILAVLLVNVFGGEEEDPSAAGDTLVPPGETTTTVVRRESEPLQPLDVTCSVEGISGLNCDNLVDGDPATEYQFDWVDLDPTTTVTVTMVFDQEVVVRQILWTNITDETRFQQNYRVARLSISDDDNVPLPIELENVPGQQAIPYTSFPTFRLEIELTDVHSAQEAEGEVFNELAIAEIEVWGFPADLAPDAGTGTDPTGGAETTLPTGGAETTQPTDTSQPTETTAPAGTSETTAG